jgi:hypothetical protein
MKVALCFIISYEHILNKEHIWREWIKPNKDIINVYFHYKNLNKIKSEWILQHAIPLNYIQPTTYFHVVPAYVSIMSYAYQNDSENTWFCLLTDSCCPIISPTKFRDLFITHYNNSIMSWKPSWWNIYFHKRANLCKLPKELHLGNTPWFILKRKNVEQVFDFCHKQKTLYQQICSGGLANESLFAIILYIYDELKENNNKVINEITHITDWSRMMSSTSPYLFKELYEKDIEFIEDNLKKNKYAMFIRKIHSNFPDNILNYYIYEYNKINEENEKNIINQINIDYVYIYIFVFFYFSMILFIGFNVILTSFPSITTH